MIIGISASREYHGRKTVAYARLAERNMRHDMFVPASFNMGDSFYHASMAAICGLLERD